MRNPVNRLSFVATIFSLSLSVLFAAGCASTQSAEDSKPAVAETKPATSVEGSKAAMAMTSYNVVRGDHLWGISGKPTIYGNPYQWPLIFKANRDKIKDADVIEPGQVFAIEKNPSSADINAAVNHAKTRGSWQLGATERSDLGYLSGYGLK